MKKSLILALLIVASLATIAQQRKPDSLIIQITIDSTSLKQVFQLIQENISSTTLTGKMVVQNIITPLQKGIKFVPNPEFIVTKPKEVIKPKEVKK